MNMIFLSLSSFHRRCCTSLYDVLFRLMIFIVFIQSCQSNKCPFFECSPEITSLDHMSINTTLTIRCIFRTPVNANQIIWKFNMGNNQRIINPDGGPVIEPFAHEIIQVNNSQQQYQQSIKSVSILHIRLLNHTYFTNYTLMNINDMCQLNVRVHLQETAMSYMNNSSFTLRHYSLSFYLILSLFIYALTSRLVFGTSR